MKIRYPLSYLRRKTRTVSVGKIDIGGNHPIRIQSMLTSHTHHAETCFQEIRSLASVGCEIIRLTIPTNRDLENIPAIRRLMKEDGIDIPLVADIHFAPHLASNSCEFFEKIRINPGNFSDRPKNSSERSKRHFDFEEGREKLKERIRSFIPNLKKYNCALRIGVNQGSLSSRMIQTYGDSPLGMVHSALEAVSLFEEEDFYNMVVSLKSSNPFVVQKAYRLFCEMNHGDNSVPLHIGVTEAGNEDIGRTKSMLGIGALLYDGIGDTVRVSLTEASANEVIFAKKLLKNIKFYRLKHISNQSQNSVYTRELNFGRMINRELSISDISIGKGDTVKLAVTEKNRSIFPEADLEYALSDKSPETLFFDKKPVTIHWVSGDQNLTDNLPTADLIVFPPESDIYAFRRVYKNSLNKGTPLGYLFPDNLNGDDFGVEFLLANLAGEGLIDVILIPDTLQAAGVKRVKNILQASRIKLTETDYIACPSCGRTLFDLATVTANIKQYTSHLKGLKIGIMGCIVNGPGEMADADFGYVGSGTGKIDLYVGQNRVKKNVLQDNAVLELINLIKSENKWIDPPAA